MDKLICLVGKSGSGKSTVAEKLGYNVVDSYTTRKPRFEGEKGHIFIPDWKPVIETSYEGQDIFTGMEGKQIEDYIDIYDMIAFEEVYEGVYYFATREQIKNKGVSIYIVDPKGAEQVMKNVTDIPVHVIYLYSTKNIRRCRMEKQGRHPSEIADRLTNDDKVFRGMYWDSIVNADRPMEEVVEDVRMIIDGC